MWREAPTGYVMRMLHELQNACLSSWEMVGAARVSHSCLPNTRGVVWWDDKGPHLSLRSVKALEAKITVDYHGVLLTTVVPWECNCHA